VRREYRESRDTMETVDGAVLIDRVRDGEVTVLDVRPREEFEAGHIRGAMSIPIPPTPQHRRGTLPLHSTTRFHPIS